MFGAGEGRRHMIYVDDVVSGLFLRLRARGARSRTRSSWRGRSRVLFGSWSKKCGRLPAASGTVSGCRSSRCWTVAGVVEDVSRRLGVEPPIYRRRMDFFWSDSEFDTARARQALDWEPRVDLPEGIRRTLEDYRSTGALAA